MTKPTYGWAIIWKGKDTYIMRLDCTALAIYESKYDARFIYNKRFSSLKEVKIVRIKIMENK